MKINTRILWAALAVFAVSACVKEEVGNDNQPNLSEGRTLTVSASFNTENQADKANTTDTKVSLTEGEEAVEVNWKESGESFTGFVGTGTVAPVPFVQQAELTAGGKAIFKGTIAPTEETALYAIYPAQTLESGSAKSVSVNLGAQKGNAMDENLTYMYAAGTIPAEGQNLGLTFHHLGSILKVEMTFAEENGTPVSGTASNITFTAESGLVSSATVDITGETPVITSVADGTISLSEPVVLENGKATVYLHLLPGDVTGLAVNAKVGDVDYSATIGASATKKVEAGRQYKASATCTRMGELTFEDIRDLLTEPGSVTLKSNAYFVGEVISDYGNENMEVSPHTAFNFVDFTVNASTAYIQNTAGTYGFRIQAAEKTASHISTLKRYSTAKVLLNGLTLTRENNPVKYTISGLTADHLLEVTEGTALTTAKSKTIAELTDNDIYTFVTLKDVEFAFDNGSYGNMHDGFTGWTSVITIGNNTDEKPQTRTDYVLRKLRDKDGDIMSMIIASQAPWRRSSGQRVPQGSGTVGGILVSSVLGYYPGGDYGTYQLRPLGLSDFNIDETEGFSAKLVEWDWRATGSTTAANGYLEKETNNATTGTGTMGSNTGKILDNAWRTVSFTEYSYIANKNYSASYQGVWKKDSWISWNFSTSEVTGSNRHLTLVFTAATGNQDVNKMSLPIYWDLEYSTNGTDFTALKEDVVIYPAPVFAYKCMDLPAGITEYVFELPDELLNQESVTLRIKAASNVCYDKTLGFAKGDTENTGTFSVRFEQVAIKYNK